MKRLSVLVLLAIALPVTAQPAEFGFDGDYHARVGFGDIPLVDAGEPTDAWNVAEYLRFTYDNTTIPLGSDQGTVVDVFCECGNVTVEGAEIVFGPDVEAGTHTVRLVRTIGSGDGVLVDFALYGGQTATIVAYMPIGYHVDAGADGTQPLTCTTGDCVFQEFPAGTSHFAILPGTASVAPAPVEPEEGIMDDLLPVLIGVLAGILVWAFLVQRGYVQKRRAQEVKKAAHVEAKESESQEMLKARKRVLMAGLKDLEMAKMNKEIDTADYDALKAELKQQAVTVMRAIDSE